MWSVIPFNCSVEAGGGKRSHGKSQVNSTHELLNMLKVLKVNLRLMPCSLTCPGREVLTQVSQQRRTSALLYINRTPSTERKPETSLTRSQVGGSATMSSSPAAAPTPLSKLASKRKTKKKHFVQQKVEVLRASDPVLSVLMWGVNHSVGVSPPPSPLCTSTQPHFTEASILLIMRRLTT